MPLQVTPVNRNLQTRVTLRSSSDSTRTLRCEANRKRLKLERERLVSSGEPWKSAADRRRLLIVKSGIFIVLVLMVGASAGQKARKQQSA